MKKLFAILLALVLVLGSAVTAFATDVSLISFFQEYGGASVENGNTFLGMIPTPDTEQVNFLKEFFADLNNDDFSKDILLIYTGIASNSVQVIFRRISGSAIFSDDGTFHTGNGTSFKSLFFTKYTNGSTFVRERSGVYSTSDFDKWNTFNWIAFKNVALPANVTRLTYDGNLYFQCPTSGIFPEPLIASHNLTINYQYADGTKAADSVTTAHDAGAAYSVDSPALTGYTPDKTTVSGTMPAADLTETVTYTPNSYNLTVNYQYTGGVKAADSVVRSVAYNSPYDVQSPQIEGYTPDRASVAGTMPNEDVTATVIYAQNVVYPVLTVNYQYEDGSKAADSVVATYIYNAPYYITSPTIDGYTPDKAVLTGRMPETDFTITVKYTKKADSGGGSGGGDGGDKPVYDPFQKPDFGIWNGYDPFKKPEQGDWNGSNPFLPPSFGDFSGYNPFKKPDDDTYSGYNPFEYKRAS